MIEGRCHCGNIRFALRWDPEPERIPARVCGCSFCVKHGGVWTSNPAGALRASVEQRSLHTIYRFGTKTADFHVCARCGIVPFVTSEIDARVYAVVSVNAFEGVERSRIDTRPASFDGEGAGDRLARRKRSWIAEVAWT